MRISKVTTRKFFVPDDPDKAWVEIKQPLPGETQDIFDKVFVQKIEYKKGKKGKMEPKFSQETDKKLDREMTLKTVITGWGEFYDRDGEKMECTPENIIKASRKIEGFNEFVNESRETMAEDLKTEKENQKKTLRSSAAKSEK